MRVIHSVTKIVYGLMGVLFVLVGGSVLLVNTGVLPEAIHGTITDYARGDGRFLHVTQESANAHLLVGLLTFWFIRHSDESEAYHWAMTAYFAVNALIHWFDARGPRESIAGPLINTVPVVVFVTLGLLRMAPARPAGTNEEKIERS
jgi:hypothetical protein